MSFKTSFFQSFVFAFSGLKTALKEESNFKIHFGVAVFTLILAAILGFEKLEWLILLLTISSVLIIELVNTVIEDTLNFLHPDIHPSAKKIKDVLAAAVLISVIFSVVIGFSLFLPKILELIGI